MAVTVGSPPRTRNSGIVHADLRPLDLHDPADVAALLAVQRAAYAVEAELIGFDGIPALRETAEELAASTEIVLGRFADGRLVAAVGYERRGDELELCRLVVDPGAFRAGHASALLDAVDAAEPGVSATRVSTGEGNEPALRLYARRGFRVAGHREVAPGVRVTLLHRP
jgi:ribosomal protein S18 acetylase RimI-like enzyme